PHHQAGRKLRRYLRAQSRARVAIEDHPRAQRAVDQGRHSVCAADPLREHQPGGAMRGEPNEGDVPLLRDPKTLGVLFQFVLCIVVLVALALWNAVDNVTRTGMATGFGFWNDTAGFDISQTLIEYSASTSTYGRAFWVGLLNTLLVSALGIVFATVLGFLIGI